MIMGNLRFAGPMPAPTRLSGDKGLSVLFCEAGQCESSKLNYKRTSMASPN